MDQFLNRIHCTQEKRMLFRYISTLTSWRSVTRWGQKQRYTNLVCNLCNIQHFYFKNHNIGTFYFTLGNLSPKYRSQLTSIYLVALVKSSFISTYGIDEVIRPFVNDVKKLVTVNYHVWLFIFIQLNTGERSRIHN